MNMAEMDGMFKFQTLNTDSFENIAKRKWLDKSIRFNISLLDSEIDIELSSSEG